MPTFNGGGVETGGYDAHPVSLIGGVYAGIADRSVFLDGGVTQKAKRGPLFPTASGRMGDPRGMRGVDESGVLS